MTFPLMVFIGSDTVARPSPRPVARAAGFLARWGAAVPLKRLFSRDFSAGGRVENATRRAARWGFACLADAPRI